MELCTGGELFDRLVSQEGKRYSEQDAARVVRQMCQSISYIHHRNICHRDLKCAPHAAAAAVSPLLMLPRRAGSRTLCSRAGAKTQRSS